MIKKICVLQFWLFLTAIAIISLQTLPEGPGLAADDKLLHFITYACLAISARTAFPIAPSTGLLWLYLLAFSITLELGQLMVPERTCEIWDMLANGTGLVLGFMALEAKPFLIKTLGGDLSNPLINPLFSGPLLVFIFF